MEKTVERLDDNLIDLGSITTETKGVAGINDDGGGEKLQMGLSDD